MTDSPLAPGDHLRIERRYVVEGQLHCVQDEGRFVALEKVGSAEHVVMRDAKSKEVRMIPLAAIAEITVVKPSRRAKAASVAPAMAAPRPEWDPGFA